MESRENLIQSLIDDGYLKTPRIIEAFRAIDRADFVLPEHRNEAYGNYPLPIGDGQTISQPLTVAFMLELLQPMPGEKILDVGSGSGWTTALLAHIVGASGKVYAIERIRKLCAFGESNVAKYGFVKQGSAQFLCRDASAGLPEAAPFDKILAGAAAVDEIPRVWREELRIGGRIAAPVDGSVRVFTKKSEAEFEEEEFPGFAFVPLVKGLERTDAGASHAYPLFLAAFVLCVLALGAFFLSYVYFGKGNFEGVKYVEIARGLGSREIAALLKREGAINSKWLFVFYVSLSGAASSLKPGTYELPHASLAEIVNLLVAGEKEEIIVIPEGWTAQDIGEYLGTKNILSKNEFTSLAENKLFPSSAIRRLDFVKDIPAGRGLEGYLFPDTYRIFPTASAEEIVVKMLENFDRKFTQDMQDEVRRQGKTVFDIVTIASLIEKEVRSDEDRALVSGILWKRLRLGIPLQVDATITYLTGKSTTKISREETRIDSSYNTYRYAGLPYGPIANPGFSALGAAVHPKESPYLYYLSTPEGRTIFSRTLEEHAIAKARYIK